MRKIFNIIVIFFIVALFACQIDSVYEKAMDIQKSSWNKKQSISFDVPMTDTLGAYDIRLTVRNTNDYPYSNLFLFVTVYSPGGKNVKDTVELTLADDKGRWLGSGFSGIWNTEKIYKQNIRFKSAGNYKIQVEQGMRDDILHGISDVTLKIDKFK